MAAEFLSVLAELSRTLAAFDPALYTGADCAAIAEALASHEKVCAGARVRAALRAADCGAHRERGFHDAEEWLARTSGSSRPKARGDLAAAKALGDCPKTAEAVAAGELSLDQAAEITKTEAECPGSEDELIHTAKNESLATLRDAARKKRQAATDPDELRNKQHAARALRVYRDDLGMLQVRGALLPEVGVSLANRLDAEAARLRRTARREGRDEPWERHVHDAFVALLAGTGAKAGGTDLVLVCDLRAYRRGHAHDGEPCHIVGGGNLPVWLLKELEEDAFLKIVFHDGVNIHTVSHPGRHIPAHLRTALELGHPPEFDGAVCCVPGCGRRYGLEWDHRDPVANGGQTSFANLGPRCKPEHWEKTEKDRLAGLLDNSIKAIERAKNQAKRKRRTQPRRNRARPSPAQDDEPPP